MHRATRDKEALFSRFSEKTESVTLNISYEEERWPDECDRVNIEGFGLAIDV